jgi:hypothetical protein
MFTSALSIMSNTFPCLALLDFIRLNVPENVAMSARCCQMILLNGLLNWLSEESDHVTEINSDYFLPFHNICHEIMSICEETVGWSSMTNTWQANLSSHLP